MHQKQSVPHARIGIDLESNIVRLKEGLSKQVSKPTTPTHNLSLKVVN